MKYSKKDAKAHSRTTMKGIWAAALMPFTSSLQLDEEGFRRNIDHWIDALKIDVDTRDHIVTLSGRVTSQSEKALAEQLARNTGEVKMVHNNLVVDAS